MPNLNEAKAQLQQALARLESVTKEKAASGQNLQQDSQAQDLISKAEMAELRRENAALKAELLDARNAYGALEEVADAVDSRLDAAISSIRNVMSHEM